MIIIGEKINASRSDARAVIEKKDEEALLNLAHRQAEAGAQYIDVNVGTGTGTGKDEVDSMAWAVKTIVSKMDTPVCVDSADPDVLEAGLRANGDKPAIINSAKAGTESLIPIINLAARFDSLLVGLAMDESGIPSTVEGRVAACEEIAEACRKASLAYEKIFFDPLVLPVSTDTNQGLITLNTISTIKTRFPGAKTVMGLSNISFGLPDRSRLNAAFLQMAVVTGLDAAIADPLDRDLMQAVTTAEVLLGRDKRCRRYLRAFRG